MYFYQVIKKFDYKCIIVCVPKFEPHLIANTVSAIPHIIINDKRRNVHLKKYIKFE